jgi:hypothetical protein
MEAQHSYRQDKVNERQGDCMSHEAVRRISFTTRHDGSSKQ